MRSLLVTGGAGFIGSAVVRTLLRDTDRSVTVVDALTYSGNPESLDAALESPRLRFVEADIRDEAAMRRVLAESQPSAILHLAAESHVDRSIDGPAEFVSTNVTGTFILLQETLGWWRSLPADRRDAFRFVHVSTDEVYGSLGESGQFTEDSPYRPSSPYSASKAASDHLVRAWHHTYGLPTITTNCSNNFGPFQFPEKLIPLVTMRALAGESLPVYGTGANVRDWLHVDDHVRALLAVLDRGVPGATYLVGANNERTNLQVVTAICEVLDELAPRPDGTAHASLITFVADRPGHDLRYAIDASKLQRDLGWYPSVTFADGIRDTVRWYLDNGDWTARVMSGAYRTERLGLLPHSGDAHV